MGASEPERKSRSEEDAQLVEGVVDWLAAAGQAGVVVLAAVHADHLAQRGGRGG